MKVEGKITPHEVAPILNQNLKPELSPRIQSRSLSLIWHRLIWFFIENVSEKK